jgi:uncharacterized protein YkwD
MGHKFRHRRQHPINVKWSVIWVIIHSISLFLMGLILNHLQINDRFFQLILLGFGITIFARIAKIFTAKKKFIIDKWFIFWSLLNAFTIYLGYILINLIEVTSTFWSTVLLAVLLVVIANIIRRFRLPNSRLIILSIVIIAILFFATSEQPENYFDNIISPDVETIDKAESSNSNYKDKISDITESIKVKVEEISEDLDTTSLKNVQKAFAELNDLRAEKGLRILEWDDRAYEMAVSRSKDMADRNYFSHLTPEGECMYSLKSQYGFGSGETVAENIWMISGGLADPDEALTSWIGSPGHHANLFYIDHVKGAIGCYGQYCVFNGINNDPYGLGNAPCSMYD